jgi:hypothetical protein
VKVAYLGTCLYDYCVQTKNPKTNSNDWMDNQARKEGNNYQKGMHCNVSFLAYLVVKIQVTEPVNVTPHCPYNHFVVLILHYRFVA